MSERHVAIPGSFRPAKGGATRLRSVDPHSQIELTLTLRGPELPDAGRRPSQPLSYEELESQYGASREDADKVARVLEGYGLKIEDVSLGTRSMRVSGSVAAMEAAFQSNLGIYHSAEQGEFRGREGDIKIPAELDGIVTSVLGFDQRRVAQRTLAGASTALAPLTPGDLETLYNFPAGDGEGQQIAIAEFGGGYFPDDLQAFCATNDLQVPAINIVPVNQPALTLQQIRQLPPQQQQQAFEESGEVMMDVEIIAGLCPNAQISVYFATFDQKGWVDLLNEVIQATPVALSVSWGLAEDAPDWSNAARTAINERLKAATLVGITVCVASGDDGSGDQMDDGRAHAHFPASSPFVLSVGGTMLSGPPPNGTEQAWFEWPGRRTRKGGGSNGGGVSIFFPRPQWQNVEIASLNPGSIDGRVVPDVSALAGPPLYDLTLLGQDAPSGGTSASTPLWAALIARVNASLPPDKQQHFLTPLLYQPGPDGQPLGKSVCTDITVGGNASHPQPGVGYQAQPGFDAVTGWGTPKGEALLNALVESLNEVG